MGYSISVKQGDMFQEQDVTFMVNASNSRLLLGSGVSRAFRLNCGTSLQTQMFQELQKHKILQQGDVVKTSCAKVKNCLYALHGVVVDGKNVVELQHIEQILYNIEKEVQNYISQHLLEKVKVVLPLLGCGVGGLNVGDVVDLYKKFFSHKVAFGCEVVVYGYKAKEYNLLLKSLR